MYSKIDSIFPFTKYDFEDAYNRIQVASDFLYDTVRNNTFNYYYQFNNSAYYQYNPLVMFNFELNGIQTKAYSTYSPSNAIGNCKTAYFIIPGSNNNQTTALMKGYDYHNINCYIKNELKTMGDVYILCKPLEDYRALIWNSKKLNSGNYVTPGNLSFVYNYLLANNRPYGINYLIEALAIIKH
ncbi:MAG: hypothetical protein IPI22_08590 [Bacteroidetes bacterium]|nr:hypothetical protein [Bacteroidota bacterium]